MRPRKRDWSDLGLKRHHEARKVISHRSLVTAAKHVYSTRFFFRTLVEEFVMARYFGVDLHRNQFTVCVIAENGREYLAEYRLEQLARFTAKLRKTDEVAVEVTGNTRLFYNAVAPWP